MVSESSDLIFSSIRGNNLRLDGGAMFGNAPKALWQRWIDVDEKNRIPIASRGLLIESPAGTILFETGCGAYLSPDMKKRFQVRESSHLLLESLDAIGVSHDQITHVVLSHLHFDHAGGLLEAWDADEPDITLMFPNARFLIGREQFERAGDPHFRDRASFIPGLTDLLENSGRLKLIEACDTLSLGEIHLEWIKSDGHTPGMMMTRITIPGRIIYFVGDLVPGVPWVNLPITMGYDRFPEQLIDEKKKLLQRVAREDAWVFYTHDHQWAISKIAFDHEKKRFAAVQMHKDFVRTGTFDH